MRDLRFLLDEVLELAKYRELPSIALLNADERAEILRQAARLSEEVLAPLNRADDVEGCSLENGAVRTRSGFKRACETMAAAGQWV